MKRRLMTLLSASAICTQLWAQTPSVSIETNGTENFRFFENRLEFLNPGKNILIGEDAGLSAGSGAFNTYVGTSAGKFNMEGSGNVYIGNSAGMNIYGSNKLVISNHDSETPLIYGQFDNPYLKFNAWNTDFTGNLTTNGAIRANSKFNINGMGGQSKTITYITDIDFNTFQIRYQTSVFEGGLLVYTSDKSDWASTVGTPVTPCGQITMIGEFSNWAMDSYMTRDEDNPDAWTGSLFLSSGNDNNQDGYIEVKFREDLSWNVNWGSTEFPTGTGTLGGANIPVPLNTNFTTTIYSITFNCKTGAYTFTDVSQ
jgi:hypothetical protein